jgi:hypothetical protein
VQAHFGEHRITAFQFNARAACADVNDLPAASVAIACLEVEREMKRVAFRAPSIFHEVPPRRGMWQEV